MGVCDEKTLIFGKWGFFIEAGCEKNLISAAAAWTFFGESKIKKLFIVCLLSICGACEEESSKFSGFNYNLKILIGTSYIKAKVLKLMDGASLQTAVVSYEFVWKIESRIKNRMPDMIICDELQRYVF